MGTVFQLSDRVLVCVDVSRAVSEDSEPMEELGIWGFQLETESFGAFI